MSDKTAEMQVARGVALRTLTTAYPRTMAAPAIARVLEGEGIYIGEDVNDVLFYLLEKGLIVGDLERHVVTRCRAHATGVDVVEGTAQATGVAVSASPDLEAPDQRGRLLLLLQLRYPESIGSATLNMMLARYAYHLPTNAGVERQLTYLVDKGLAAETQASSPHLGLEPKGLWRLTSQGVDLIESRHNVPGVALPARA
jgi:hypothetical protein